MSTTPKPVPSPEEAERQFEQKLEMVCDAFTRIRDKLQSGKLQPSNCAYIDTQLAKVIGWLASARAIVVVQGGLAVPMFDDGVTIYEDDDVEITRFPTITRKDGGAS